MKYKITLLFLLIVFALSAQDADSKKYRIPKYTVKWSPLHLLINHYPTIQIAIEQRISKNISFQYDFGPVVSLDRSLDDNSNGNTTTNAFGMRGYKAKFEIRRYLVSPAEHLWLPYVSSEFYYNRVNYKKGETVSVNSPDGSFQYYRFMKYNMQYREPGINIKGGIVFRTHRFLLDFQVGVMARFISYNSVNKPSIANQNLNGEGDDVAFPPLFPFGPLLETNEEDRTLISPSGCIRIGYIIK